MDALLQLLRLQVSAVASYTLISHRRCPLQRKYPFETHDVSAYQSQVSLAPYLERLRLVLLPEQRLDIVQHRSSGGLFVQGESCNQVLFRTPLVPEDFRCINRSYWRCQPRIATFAERRKPAVRPYVRPTRRVLKSTTALEGVDAQWPEAVALPVARVLLYRQRHEPSHEESIQVSLCAPPEYKDKPEPELTPMELVILHIPECEALYLYDSASTWPDDATARAMWENPWYKYTTPGVARVDGLHPSKLRQRDQREPADLSGALGLLKIAMFRKCS